MHEGNRVWWHLAKRLLPQAFIQARVLEVGSMNINGTVRDFFEECDYTGVDFRQGEGVDVVSLAHEMRFDEPFDTVVSAQMLEHDPYWNLSLHRMIECLKPTGHLMLSFGPAHTPDHHPEASPDGKTHPLPAQRVVELLRSSGLTIERAHYERDIPENLTAEEEPVGNDNYFVILAAMPKADLCKEPLISRYLAGDRIGDDLNKSCGDSPCA